MHIPTPTIDAPILRLLSDIEVERRLLSGRVIPPHLHRHLDERHMLRSALYSARIEGVEHTEHTLTDSKDAQTQEVYQLLDALRYVRSLPEGTPVTIDLLNHLHRLCMQGIGDAGPGTLRTTQNAIYSGSGAVVYLPPPPALMRTQLMELMDYLAIPQEFPLVQAMMAHLVFERIHPYIDGNGRVGRLLILLTLKSRSTPWPYVVPLERSLERDRSSYYHHLQAGMSDPTSYLLMMLDAMYGECVELARDIATSIARDTDETLYTLSPRQLEIHTLMREQRMMTMDQIARRFARVPLRSVRADVAHLLTKGLVRRIGATRGSYYQVKAP